ncbi:MAG: CRISPR system precrRNA processing endoribonuclease RAMP protein Cas6 [Nitrospirae bacterium]|nr:CRISPR system precrRNA processing endoribonuclease RAMP protein Cas6 [Candidatus Manganitrophaceae bacterium]
MFPSALCTKTALLLVSRFHFTLVVTSPIYLPKNKGATLRGGFGNALKAVCCTVPHTACSDCPRFRVCAYPTLFETPLPIAATRMVKGNAIPRPFVIEPPLGEKMCYAPGDVMTLSLVLIGKASASLPYFVRAFEVLGKEGLGMGRGHFKVETVQLLETEKEPVVECQNITLHFLTPTRIVVKGQAKKDLDFPLLFRTLLRRIENLRAFHGVNHDGALDPPVHAEAVQVISSSLKWIEQERYSSRQKQNMPQDGFVGKISFEGNLGSFLPYLSLGELVHVGKGATFGMGRFEINT